MKETKGGYLLLLCVTLQELSPNLLVGNLESVKGTKSFMNSLMILRTGSNLEFALVEEALES